MNLRDLHYLLAIAETRSFNRAAAQCHVSQPTLSMQIKKLEEELGVRLLERSNKRVMLTDSGAQIVGIARRIVEDESKIRNAAKLMRDPFAGMFRLGAIPTLASYIFPAFVPTLVSAFPKLKLLLVEDKTERLLEQLKKGDIDAAVLALPAGDAALAEAHLFDDPFILAVGSKHPLAKYKSIAPAELEGHQILLLDEGHCLRDQALSLCHARGAREDESFRATSLETLRLMVRVPESRFMTLIPRVAADKNDGLHYIPFTKPVPMREIGFVWRKSSSRTQLIDVMLPKLRKVAEKL